MPAVIYLRKNSYLTTKFNEEIMLYAQSGLFQMWRNLYINDMFYLNRKINAIIPKQLTNEHLNGGYQICGIILIFSIFIFTLEILSNQNESLKTILNFFH